MDDDFLPSLLLGLGKFIVFAGGSVLSCAVVILTLYIVHFLFSLPMRRAERARLFLDLVEDAIRRGQSIEDMILSLAKNRDRTLGMRFHLLAAYIEGGLKLGAALQKVPQFLPPQVNAILQTGAKSGDIKCVLPAGREILRDHPAGVRSAMHYMMLVILFFSPVAVFIITLMSLFVIPRFKDVAAGMGLRLWPLARFVFGNVSCLVDFEIVLTAMLVLATLIYVGGPGLARCFQSHTLPLVDWLAWHIPWKRKRLLRTFSAMLAVLLDGGVPEAEAVRLAADCTANEMCRRRSLRVIHALGQGAKLDDAVRAFDHSGEFHWRLSNAGHVHGGFLQALSGWHESLDAKAFQQEEATAHMVTSGLVILNGLVVALIAIAMFGILISVLNGVLLSS